jgi:predicted esterase
VAPMQPAADPHAGQPVLQLGPPPGAGRLAVLLVHGRGASAEDILGLAVELALDDVTWLAPQAAGHAWYPHPFLAPLADNEPHLSSALRRLAALVDELAEAGVPAERVALVGFSQGACLACEHAARDARRWAAVAGLSGGLIGPPGTPRDYPGSLDGTPVLLGCSDVDPHIPLARVHETADVLSRLGAVVDERIYPRLAHTINRDELAALRALLAG